MNVRDHAFDAVPTPDIASRVSNIDWAQVSLSLDAQGNAVIRSLLSEHQCDALRAMYADSALFRSRVVMARHGFGRGEYQYFAYPLPEPIAQLRPALYESLAPIANRWHAAMGVATHFPSGHGEYLDICHAAGQCKATPLLLHYTADDYNCLHQDVYGEHVFPLQVVILLSQPGDEFDGGEFVMTEQRPRMQSRPLVVPLRKGDAAVIAVRQRPVRGARGTYRVNLRHGVSRVHGGERFTAGVLFHDAA